MTSTLLQALKAVVSGKTSRLDADSVMPDLRAGSGWSDGQKLDDEERLLLLRFLRATLATAKSIREWLL